MSKRVTKLSELKNGQRVVALKPTLLGVIKVEYLKKEKDGFGGYTYKPVEKPAMARPDILKQYRMQPLGKNTMERNLSDYWLIDGLEVADGPCRNRDCSMGLVRDKVSGDHKSCKTCFGGWLS